MIHTTVIPRVGAEPVEIDGSTVIVSDSLGNPLVVLAEIADGTTMITTINDDDFNRVLESLGLDKVVVNNRLVIDGPPSNAELLYDPNKRNQLILEGS